MGYPTDEDFAEAHPMLAAVGRALEKGRKRMLREREVRKARRKDQAKRDRR